MGREQKASPIEKLMSVMIAGSARQEAVGQIYSNSLAAARRLVVGRVPG